MPLFLKKKSKQQTNKQVFLKKSLIAPSCLPLHYPFAVPVEFMIQEVMKPNELQFKQFGKPRGKTVMQIIGSKLLLTTASSNISPSV